MAIVKKILIVEDNETNRFLFSSFLREHGYRTLEAGNGLEGVALAQKEKPNLILMDIHMPVMDGFEALKILRSESATREIPSIAMTSLHLPEGRCSFMKLGFVDHLKKPFGIKELMRIVEEYVNPEFTNL